MMRVALITNAPPTSGAGKPAHQLVLALRSQSAATLEIDHFVLDPTESNVRRNGAVIIHIRRVTELKPLAWVRLARALAPHLAAYDIVHLTNQTLGFLVPRLRTTVLTVWDLIELLDPQERGGSLVARYLYRGIPKAHQVITVSRYTAGKVQERFRVPNDRLSIIPPAVSPLFRFIPALWETVGGKDFAFQQKLALDQPIVLYVGSEHRRKNLRRLLEAIAIVRQTLPRILFVKIGSAGSATGHAEFAATVSRLKLTRSVRVVTEAHDEELLYWYHAATLLAFPSLFEGFGLPPLEAMACGTPVVTSARTSLPEVVGDAAVTIDPESVESIVGGLLRVLTDGQLRSRLRQGGITRAAMFSWTDAARKTIAVYERVRARAATAP